MNIKDKFNNSFNFYAKTVDNINNELQQKEQHQYINNEKIIVGDSPKTYYYLYDNDEYYFTAQNAKFSIDPFGKITWYYGQWIDGFFRDGLWIDGVWHDGTFCRGNWLDGQWKKGNWYKGKINGTFSKTHP